MVEADLNPHAIVDPAVARTGRTNERSRPDTAGARLLRCLPDVYAAARGDTEFARAMNGAVQQALLERTTRPGAGQQRIEETLAAGAERLHLAARHQLGRQAAQSARTADDRAARHRFRRARGGTGAVARLAWPCDGRPRDISVHCVTGRGGAGKTRLAIELCEWAERAGWSAGFVRQDELDRFHKRHHPSEWRWRGRHWWWWTTPRPR